MPISPVLALRVGAAAAAVVIGSLGSGHLPTAAGVGRADSIRPHSRPHCAPAGHHGGHHRHPRGTISVSIPPTVIARMDGRVVTSVSTNTGYAPAWGDVFSVVSNGRAHLASRSEERAILAAYGCSRRHHD